MIRVVEAEAADCADVVLGEGAEEEADARGAVCEGGRLEDVAVYDAGRFGEAGVGGVGGEDGVAVVDVVIVGEEADESLDIGKGKVLAEDLSEL
jgi:hypothetical protein